LYGWYHRRTLQTEYDKHQIEHAIHNRERLIAEAKDAWKRKQDDTTGSPSSDPFSTVLTTAVFSVVSNPDDPRFDLEKLIAKWEKSS